MKKYHEISILHVIACGMILLCHFFQDAYIGSLGEIFLSGLSLFFIVSGFLTGLKPAYNKQWIKSRIRRILIPYYIVICPLLCILYFFTNEFRTDSAIHLLTATQGINYFIWPYHGYGAMVGLGHLWYVTIILLCFVLTPFWDKVYKKFTPTTNQTYYFFAICICFIQPLLIIVGIQIGYIISFLIGFMIAKTHYVITTKRFICIVSLFSAITIIRFISMWLIDGSVIYDRYIALVSQGSLAILVFSFIFYLGQKFETTINRIGKSNKVLLLASIIYEIYLLHYFFLRGPWPIKQYVDSVFIADLIVVILSVCIGLILSRLIIKPLSNSTK